MLEDWPLTCSREKLPLASDMTISPELLSVTKVRREWHSSSCRRSGFSSSSPSEVRPQVRAEKVEVRGMQASSRARQQLFTSTDSSCKGHSNSAKYLLIITLCVVVMFVSKLLLHTANWVGKDRQS